MIRARPLRALLAILALSLALGGCTSSSPDNANPGSPPPNHQDSNLPTAPGAFASGADEDPRRLQEAARILLHQAERPGNQKEGGGSGFALAACELAWRSLVSSAVPAPAWLQDPASLETLKIYNSALEKFISSCPGLLAPGRGNFEFQTPLGPLVVSPRYSSSRSTEAGSERFTAYFDEVIPASSIQKTGFTNPKNPDGLGVALVGVRKLSPERAPEMQFLFPHKDLHIPLSAMATFSKPGGAPSRMRLSFHDPRQQPRITTGSGPVEMAADFSAPLALTFAGRNDLRTGIHALFNLDTGFGNEGIYLTEPFDPDRTPVLLLHGLFASPLVWRDVVAKSLESPAIRKNYQFWYGFFSTGMPLTPSIAKIRERIAYLRQAGDPGGKSRASQTMILIGHSMGGVVARALATDIGNHYWESLSDIPFQDLAMESGTKKILQSWFFWEPASDTKRIIFLATPHHGTEMANLAPVRLSQAILEWPKNLIEFLRFVGSGGRNSSNHDHLQKLTKPFTPAFSHILSAIDSLAPNAPLYKAFDTAPLVDGVRTHSILGDRGRPQDTEISDGVIAYWSSRLPSAQSETILPVNHDLQSHSQCAVEIQRILLEELER